MKFSCLSTVAFVSAVLGQTQLHPGIFIDKCLEVRGDVRTNGTPVQIFDCNDTPAQQWEYVVGPTAIRLAGSNFCIDVGNAPTNGTLMKIWECFPGIPAQSWSLTTNSQIDLRLTFANQGLCLDLPNGDLTNTNVVQVWKCVVGNTNQIWTNFD